MDSKQIKERLAAISSRVIVDFNDYNHMTQLSRKLDEAEKIVSYMEEKHILKLEKAKANVASQEPVVKKKVSKKKASVKPDVVDVVVEDSNAELSE